MPERADDLRAVLEGLEAKKRSHGAVPSAARLHIRSAYDAIVDARKRGVSWQQVTEGMFSLGIRAADGEVLDWREVSSLFHAERYARGGKRMRRKGSAPVPAAAPKASTAVIPEEVQETPAEEFAPATPRSPVQSARPTPAAPKPAKIDATDAISRFLGKPRAAGVKMPPIPEPEDE